jgi:hypothetical protein
MSLNVCGFSLCTFSLTYQNKDVIRFVKTLLQDNGLLLELYKTFHKTLMGTTFICWLKTNPDSHP